MLSQSVLNLEAQLKGDLQRPDLADLIRSIQDNERDKLRYTMTIQALKEAESRQQFSWQQPETGKLNEALTRLRR